MRILEQDIYKEKTLKPIGKTSKPSTISLQEDQKQNRSELFNRELPHGHMWPSPIEMLGENAILKIDPLYGQHRPDKDAVFSFASGVSFKELVRFVGSLLSTGFDGDIVVAVEQKHELSEERQQFLDYHSRYSNLIAYPAELVCKKIKIKKRCKVYKMFRHKQIGGYLPDPRPHRELAQLRFEYYWAWSTLYSSQARLFLLDSRDLIFQLNPFEQVPYDMEKKIMVFEESDLRQIGYEPNNRLWLREGHERKYLLKLGRRSVVCAGTIVGGQAAIETFCRAMVQQWDSSQCTIYGCDQGHVNFLVHGNFLVNSPNIEEVILEKFGRSFVMSLSLHIIYGNDLRKSKIFEAGSNRIMNKAGTVAAIVHQFDKDSKLKRIFDENAEHHLKDWEAMRPAQ